MYLLVQAYQHLWLEARELPGTKNATLPFWSADGKQIGFFADGKLKRARLACGSAEPICDAASGRGASWGTKDVIVFSPSPAGPLYQVRPSGGTPEAVTTVDSTQGETAHRWPSFLPDGEHFTYAALPVKNGQFACYVGSLRSKQRTPLLTAVGAPIYAAPGYLIFSRQRRPARPAIRSGPAPGGRGPVQHRPAAGHLLLPASSPGTSRRPSSPPWPSSPE